MFLSYLKIAWKVLLRRKVFTAISLFGISFTLMILLVVYAFYDFTVGPQMPETRVDRLLFITRMQFTYDGGGRSMSGVGYAFMDRYVRTLRTPEKVSLSEGGSHSVAAYAGEHMLKLDRKLTDAEFWQLLNFDFVAGRPYTPGEVRDAAHVAVLNESTSRHYFGTTAGVVGRPFEADGVRYRVLGVVRDVPVLRTSSYADFWVPITLTTGNLHDPDYMGGYQAIVLARNAAEVPAVQQEYTQVIKRLPVPEPQRHTTIQSYAHTLAATAMARFVNSGGTQDGGVGVLVQTAALLALLFMLLPALNLVNVNVSRMLERSSEIGVRKAFGATAGTLVRQFLVENIFLTLLGGVLGLGLAAGALALLNDSHFLPYSNFALNGRVFGAALGVIFFFGLLSGTYPAYKMSKLPAVKALKGDTTA